MESIPEKRKNDDPMKWFDDLSSDPDSESFIVPIKRRNRKEEENLNMREDFDGDLPVIPEEIEESFGDARKSLKSTRKVKVSNLYLSRSYVSSTLEI